MMLKNIIYSIIDLLILGKGLPCYVNGFKVMFPAKWFRYFENDYEKENILFLKEKCKPNMIIFDIGAHLGLMSMICSQLLQKKGKIYSFEPTPKTFEILKKVIKINKASDLVIPINKAVAKENKTIDFYLSEDEGSNSNSLVSKNHRERKPIQIQVTSLDLFTKENNIKQIDLIKIDAEGSEYDVLLGAKNIISAFKPIIILALHPPLIKNNGHNIEDIYEFLIAHNYCIKLNGSVIEKKEFCTKEDFFDVHLTTNL
jgi:FkbM family methyltransferase